MTGVNEVNDQKEQQKLCWLSNAAFTFINDKINSVNQC